MTNPTLGTGLVAGFRTAGDSERPGFAWFFGRDALWSSFALSSTGDFANVRTALDFLAKYQRKDGKIPHEISQSAALIPWFSGYKYPWNATDATPLFVIAHADLYRATGDAAYLKESWDGIARAWRYAAASDLDHNGLIDNSKSGHGWVEGGALYPPHEEFYLQGLWIEACSAMAELAAVAGDAPAAKLAKDAGARAAAAAEKIYWLPERGFYAFATMQPPEEPRKADPGPNRERIAKRMAQLDKAAIVDEDTVLPAVPLWFGRAQDERAQSQVDHLGAAAMAADWGQRIIANDSELYDPISYHYGSVWPLFTGWTAMGAYRYGRPHVAFQSLMANVLLDAPGARGSVTELLSGDFMYPFGRSSPHQVWSEAMVLTPIVRGLFGLELSQGGKALRIAPQLPATWEHAAVRRIPAAGGAVDLVFERAPGRFTVAASRSGAAPLRLLLSPAFPQDARVARVTAAGKELPFTLERRGDRQFVKAEVDGLDDAGDGRRLRGGRRQRRRHRVRGPAQRRTQQRHSHPALEREP